MKSNSIRVAIVDDHTLFRKTLKDYLSEQSNIEVVIQSADVPDPAAIPEQRLRSDRLDAGAAGLVRRAPAVHAGTSQSGRMARVMRRKSVRSCSFVGRPQNQ